MPGWINLFSGHSNPAGWPLDGAFSGVVGVHFRFYFKMKRRQTGA